MLAHKLPVFENELVIAGVYNKPVVALEAITGLDIDVLFFDVEMPGMNGFQFLERLGSFNFEVIFTTAYGTLEALRLSAVYYLLKPIDEEEQQTAIIRLKKRVNKKQTTKSLRLKKSRTTAWRCPRPRAFTL